MCTIEGVKKYNIVIWAATSEFVSSSIPSWHILTAHAQPFSGARDLVFCLKVPLDSLLVWASSEGSGETARMRRLAWTFAARIGDKYQIRLARPIYLLIVIFMKWTLIVSQIWLRLNGSGLLSLFDCLLNSWVCIHLPQECLGMKIYKKQVHFFQTHLKSRWKGSWKLEHTLKQPISNGVSTLFTKKASVPSPLSPPPTPLTHPLTHTQERTITFPI